MLVRTARQIGIRAFCSKPSSDAVIEEIRRLYQKVGDKNYIGEDVSQLEHSLQCAACAENSGAEDEVVLAALLHDIGHFIGEDQQLPSMLKDGIDWGTDNHEGLGKQYVEDQGFSERIGHLVLSHTTAKRYLCTVGEAYYNKLTEASKMTLEFQGGKMNEQERANFETHTDYQVILDMRNWDEAAKEPDLVVPDFEHYVPAMQRHLDE
jgi:predicted HD phosphohydrolase